MFFCVFKRQLCVRSNKPKTKTMSQKPPAMQDIGHDIHSVEEKQVFLRQMLTTVITDESFDTCIFLSYYDFDHCLLNSNI